MLSAAIIFQQTSWVIPQAIVLYRGRDSVLPPRHFSLGRLGPFINGLAVVWVVFLDVLYCFPVALPVTPQNMSWVSVVSTGLVAFVIALWFTTKKGVFKGPEVDHDWMNQRRLAAIEGERLDVDVSGSGTQKVERESEGF